MLPIIEILIQTFAPHLIDKAIQKTFEEIGCYRTVILTLPIEADRDELFSFIKTELPQANRNWILQKNQLSKNFESFLGNKKYIASNIDQNDYITFLVFLSGKGIVGDNYGPQYTILLLKHIQTLGEFLFIISTFITPRIVERGTLEKNCSTALEAVKKYFNLQGINIQTQIASAEYYKDSLTKHDKPIPLILFILGVIIGSCFVIFLVVLIYGIISFFFT